MKNLQKFGIVKIAQDQKKIHFQWKGFPIFQPNLFCFFFLHPRIWPEAIYNSTKLDFPNLDVFHDFKKKKKVVWACGIILIQITFMG
jgi:hypothetical protein